MRAYRDFFGLAILVLAGAFAGIGDAQAQSSSPNIVLILADDLGYGDIGAYGATDIATPNIDRLASEGVRLTDFAVTPTCGATRAMLLTGSYPPRASLARNHTPSAATGISANEVTLAELLKREGYATGIFGKWHLGDHYQFRPQRHGFDEFFGLAGSNNMWPFHPRTKETPGEDPRLTAARERAELTGYAGQFNSFRTGEGYPNLPLYDGDRIVEFNSDQTTFGATFFDRTLEFIEQNRNDRFFAYVALTAPHVPLHPAPAFVGASARGLYGDTVQEIDFGVGRILDKLVELGIDDETLVIFLSDNGPWLEYGIDGGSAGPLSGGKEQLFEGGIRVPALLRWPGRLGAGSVIDAPLSGVDLLPTLAGLAGATLPGDRTLDGVDIWPLLTGQSSSLPRSALFGFNEGDFTTVDLGIVRSGDWKLHVDTSGSSVTPVALYNLASDIGETIDVRASHPDVVSSLVSLGQQIVADIRSNQRPLGRVELSGMPFRPTDASAELISIEAENYHERQAAGGQNWEPVSLRHSSAEQSMQALPDRNTNNDSGYASLSPRLGYRVAFEAAGRHYVWVRARGQTTSDDSLHVGLNGQPVPSGYRVSNVYDYWTWTSTRMGTTERIYVDVPSAGEHRFDVWMREDGTIIDKLILTTDPDFTPLGKGLVESRQGYDDLAIPPVAVDDGPYTVEEGAAFAGTVNVLDNDEPDPRNDPMHAVLVSPPQHAAEFELRPDGSFTYIHDGSETTADSFTYTANDVDGASSPVVVRLSVLPVNDRPVLELSGAAELAIEVGSPYTDPGATAFDAEDGDLTAAIVTGGDAVDSGVIGEYVVTYDVTDTEGQAAPTVTRTVVVVDANPPVITLIGAPTVEVTEGGAYIEPGVSATDPEEGDISSRVVIGGDTVDTSTVGTYVITFNVSDSFGNAAEEVSRTVVVVEDEPPTITLNGSAAMSVDLGSSFSDPGATASDKEDGDLTSDIVVGGAVDTSTAGTYVLRYNVTDSGGNAAAEVRRTVTVTAPPEQQSSGGGGGGRFHMFTLLVLGLVALRRRWTIQS